MTRFRSMTRRHVLAAGLAGAGGALLAACGAVAMPQTETEPEQVSESAYAPVTIENCDLTITYDQPPQRAVAMAQHATEVMLTLGLQDHMVGTAYLEDPILPNLADAYQTDTRTLGHLSVPRGILGSGA